MCDHCFPGITHTGTDASKIANLQPGLIPSEGLWRGGTHWTPDGAKPYNPGEWQQEFDRPLHLFRNFKGGEWSKYAKKGTPKTTLDADEVSFVEKGGILWYGWQASTRHHGEGGWAEWFPAEGQTTCKNENEKKLWQHARAVRSLAPALVMVAVGWEPDGHAGAPVGQVAEDSHEYFGTPEEYVKQYEHAQKRFGEYGAYNAVWIIDFSHKPAWDPHYRPVVKELIPPKIDWIFWNLFQYNSKANYNNFKKKRPDKFTSPAEASESLGGFYDLLSGEPKAQGKPWGVGAWGSTYKNQNPSKVNKWGTKGELLPVQDRIDFIKGTQEWLSNHKDKMKAAVFFDSLDSTIADTTQPGVVQIKSTDGTETTSAVVAKGDLAHNFELSTYPTSPELVPAFKEYNAADVFTTNDDMIAS